ncbi:hypothetical protein [Geosporobacter ferrireducens]|uniref:hypothetical protein n=1 Tax=Geosporobacter ferrireducens TaxID=1424294 RepID=UPI00139AD22A|nr:hypothetical protein [Geosporobacter ferrireducens]MTI53322.1 hypothetical protein [Geosporobacter ferrireducens]
MIKQEKSLDKNKIGKRDNVVLGSLYIILFFIHFYSIQDMTLPIVLDDEFAYLANAAFLVGYDWSSVVSQMMYYASGYSLLIVPIFMFFDNPLSIYKSALILNSIIASGIFFIAYGVIKQICTSYKKENQIMFSFVISLYPSYVVYSKLSWAESLLSFLFWCCFLCFLHVGNNRESRYLYLLTGILLGYNYMVHSRTIGILLSGVLIMIYGFIISKITKKQLFFFCTGLVPMLFAQVFLKRYLIANLWLNSNSSDLNNFSSIISKFSNLSNFQDFIQVLFGHLYYLGISSYLLAYIGLCFSTILVFNRFIKPFINKTSGSEDKNILKEKYMIDSDNVHLGYTFLLLSVVTTIIIGALFLTGGTRGDHLVYGRYNESVIGPVILIGMVFIIEKVKCTYWTVFSRKLLLVVTFGTIFLNIFLTKPLRTKPFNFSTSISFFPYYDLFGSIDMIIPSIITLTFFIILYNILKTDKKNRVFLYCIFLSIVFLFNSYIINSKYLLPMAKDNETFINDVNLINKYNLADDIYFVDVTKGSFMHNRNKDFYQFLLLNHKLNFVSEEELDNIDTVSSFIIMNGLGLNSLRKESELLKIRKRGLANESDFLWVSSNDIKNRIKSNGIGFISDGARMRLPLEIFSTENGIMNGNDLINEYIESDGKAGFLAYGPYIYVKADDYQLELDIELIETRNEEIGHIDIVGEGKLLYKQKIIKDHFYNNEYSLKSVISLEKDIRNLEIRVYSNEGVKLRINHIGISSAFTNISWLPKDIFETQNGIVTENGTFVSNGEEGFLLYGPYQKMKSGRYKLVIEGISEEQSSELGFVDIVADAGKTIIAKSPIDKKELQDGYVVRDFLFDITSPLSDVEFRVCVPKNTIIEVKNIKIEKVD